MRRQSRIGRCKMGLWVLPAVVLTALFAGDLALHIPTICPYKLTTGLPCGGCGMTRAFVAFARGQWRVGLGFNPLAPMVAVGMIGWFGAAVRTRWTGKQTPSPPPWLWLAAFAAFILLQIGRGLSWLPHPGS